MAVHEGRGLASPIAGQVPLRDCGSGADEESIRCKLRLLFVNLWFTDSVMIS